MSPDTHTSIVVLHHSNDRTRTRGGHDYERHLDRNRKRPRISVVAVGVVAVSVVAVSLLALVAFGAGCSPAQSTCPLPESSTLVVRPGRRLNVDDAGRSLPTLVRIYQLTDLGRLENATFESIWRDPEATLADSVVAADEITVYPGRSTVRSFERNPEAHFIVGVVIVRRPAGVSWRTVLELPPPRTEQQCALAASEDDSDDEQAGAPPIPFVTLELEDYHIDGILELVPAGSACARRAPDAPGCPTNGILVTTAAGSPAP